MKMKRKIQEKSQVLNNAIEKEYDKDKILEISKEVDEYIVDYLKNKNEK